MERRSLAAPAALVLALAASVASAQGGYRKEKHPDLGFDFPRPRDYEEVPTQPEDPWSVLYYVEKEAFRERDRKQFRPELSFMWIDRGPERPIELASALPDADDTGEAAEPEEPPVYDFESWFERYLRDWEIGDATLLDEADGNRVTEYALVPKSRASSFLAWVCAFDDGKRTLFMLGHCLDEDYEDQVDIWRYMARKARFYTPEARDLTKLRRYYDRRDYSDPEYRIEIRAGLARGWEADDTDNYIVVYSTKDEPLIRIIKSELEAIREEYVKLFPPVVPVTAVSTVRVCKDRAEYIKYGGPPTSGGYWNSSAEELVFYDYENKDGKKGTGKADTRVVLYHEAFHQYVFYAVGELPPHSWFNEGTGDYFSGAIIRGGRVKKIDVNPWRIELVQLALQRRRGLRPIPFEEILRFEQPEFYRRDRAALCYAQAWSMIYFLRTAKEVERRPEWAAICDAYFETLKREYASELAAVEVPEGGEIPPEAKAEAGRKAREKAVDLAFSDVDLRELEEAWREYVLDLKVPR